MIFVLLGLYPLFALKEKGANSALAEYFRHQKEQSFPKGFY